MPELPEVQTTVDGINKYTKNLVIKDVWTNYNSSFHKGKDNIKDPKYFSYFKKSILGAKIKTAERRGKNILITLNNGKTILAHMKMTGHFLYGTYTKKDTVWTAKEPALKNDSFNGHIRLVFLLSNKKSLALSDMRRFAKVTLVDTDRIEDSEHIKHHGPEPLDSSFTLEKFKSQLFLKPHWPIKKTLMDLTVIVGIGNIYSDEILWRAGIHPLERVENISPKAFPLMFKAMKEILRKGISFGGDSMSDYRNIEGKPGKFQTRHEAYQRTGEKCRKNGCDGTIKRIVIAGRSAHFCNTHQKLEAK